MGEIQPEGEGPGNAQATPHDLFANLTMNENLDGVQSEAVENGVISELDAPEFPMKKTKRELTDEGFRTTTNEAFLLTQAGNIIQSEALIGGGSCCNCGAVSDRENTYMCMRCHRIVCRLFLG